MTDLALIRFELSDLMGFKPLQEDPYLWKKMSDNMSDKGRVPLSLINKETKEVVALCGINFIRPRTVEVWSIRGANFKKYKFGYFKTLRRFIHNDLLGNPMAEVDRVEIGIRCDEPHLFKWAEKLGGTFECVAKKYADGIDHRVYSVVKGD